MQPYLYASLILNHRIRSVKFSRLNAQVFAARAARAAKKKTHRRAVPEVSLGGVKSVRRYFWFLILASISGVMSSYAPFLISTFSAVL